MSEASPEFELRYAAGTDDLAALQRLRYEVFVAELGAGGAMVDHEARREMDRFDAYFDHLMLLDHARDDHPEGPVVGVYRMLRAEVAGEIGGFYTEAEYDIAALKTSGRRILELGRSCVHADYRGGTAMYHLFNGLAEYVARHEIEVLFGVASFHGTDLAPLAAPLSLLHHRHLASEELRPRAIGPNARDMNILPEDEIDRAAAMRATPALLKSYLRLGGGVGQGAFVDHAFNTVDVAIVMDTKALNARQKSLYTREMRA